MENETYALLNCNNHLRENLNVFVEAFVKFYGEERRQEIEERFRNALFIGYKKLRDTPLIISKAMSETTRTIIKKRLDSLESEWSVEQLATPSFEYINTNPLYQFHDFYTLYKIGAEKREKLFKQKGFNQIQHFIPVFTKTEFEEMYSSGIIPDKYKKVPKLVYELIEYYIDRSNFEKDYIRAFNNTKPLLEHAVPDISINNFGYYLDDKKIQDLISLSDDMPAISKEYHQEKDKLDEFIQEIAIQKKLETVLHLKYYKKLIGENIDLLKDKDNALKFLNGEIKEFDLDLYTRYIMGYTVYSSKPLEAFSKEAEEILAGDNKWKTDSIKRQRIEYYKKNGLDLGNDYKQYEESKEARKLTPSFERVETFMKRVNEIVNEYNIELATALPSYKKRRAEIDNLNFVDKNDSFNAARSTLGGTFVNPNIVKTEDGHIMYPLVVLEISSDNGYNDHSIVHEMNHLFELYLEEVTAKDYTYYSGWDHITSTISDSLVQVDTLEDHHEIRHYELFNEAINELIAQEISELMVNNNMFVFDNPTRVNYKGISSYDRTFILAKPFYNEFRQSIIASRSNGNIQIILDEVGKENFDAFCELFNNFHQHFSKTKTLYDTYTDLNANRETNNTRLFKELIRQRNEILKKMSLYSMSHKKAEVIPPSESTYN